MNNKIDELIDLLMDEFLNILTIHNKFIFSSEYGLKDNFDFNNIEFNYERFDHYLLANRDLENQLKNIKNTKFFDEFKLYLEHISAVKFVYDEIPDHIKNNFLVNYPLQLNTKKAIELGLITIPESERPAHFELYTDSSKLNRNDFYEFFKDKSNTYIYALYHNFNIIYEIYKNLEAYNIKENQVLIDSVLHGDYPIREEFLISIFNDFISPYFNNLNDLIYIGPSGDITFSLKVKYK